MKEQTKGRIITAGMNGVLCVSEYSPFQDLLFKEEVPTFFTKEECIKILDQLLTDEELFSRLSNKFTKKIRDMFEDKNSFKLINEAIEKKK